MPKAVPRTLLAACAMARFWLRHMPFGRSWVWNRIVRPYLAWRSFPIPARTQFGARLEGQFPDTVHTYVYFFGVWEPAITAFYRAALRPGDIVVDIGANVGLHAMLAARLVGPSGRVHAIEASPWIYRRLLRNLAANGVGNVRCYNLAVTDKATRVPVYLHDETNLGGTTIVATEAARLGAIQEATVEGGPLGGIVPAEELSAARLIKIDVEGAEWLVAQGMRDVLPGLRDDAEILVEVKPAALEATGGSLDALIGLFRDAGFEPYEIANDYSGEFYIRQAAALPAPLTRRDFEMADLVFRRARH